MKVIDLELTGVTPMLQHRMSDETLMGLILGSKVAPKPSKAPESLRDIAEAAVYRLSNGKCAIPTEYVRQAFIGASADFRQKSSSRKSIKGIAGAVLRPTEECVPILGADDEPVDTFELDVRRGVNHQRGAVGVVRPRFENWKVRMTVEVDDDLVAPAVVHDVLNAAGRKVGLGSFRVANRGFFGQFRVTKFDERSS